MHERQSRCEADTIRLAESLGELLVPGDVVALEGPLGAGKTCFVRGLARGMGIDPGHVSSPTFVLCQEYTAPDDRTLIHIDAYRMQSPEDLESIGWEEITAREDAVVAVEWGNRVPASLWPRSTIRVTIEPLERDRRRLSFDVPDREADRFARLAARTAKCRTCGKEVPVDDDDFPFCSRRCRLVDLGDWFSERHRIAGSATGEASEDVGESETS